MNQGKDVEMARDSTPSDAPKGEVKPLKRLCSQEGNCSNRFGLRIVKLSRGIATNRCQDGIPLLPLLGCIDMKKSASTLRIDLS